MYQYLKRQYFRFRFKILIQYLYIANIYKQWIK